MGQKKSKKKGGGCISVIFEFGLFILAVLLIAMLLSRYVVERVVVRNHSMEHTLESGDSVLIDKISYRFRDPKRFDIIVFKQKGQSDELIKRVIGLPHERVLIKDGKIYINGEEIEDCTGLDKPEYAGIAANPIELSVGEYFVIGDNREESIDSRYPEIGTVTSTRITGRMFMRIKPLNRFKIFWNNHNI